jgi:hypothetical protein
LQRWSRGSILLVVAVILAACGTGSPGTGSPGHRAKDHGRSSTVAAATGSSQPYQLYTHCGIDEARVGSRYFEAVHPLSDGNDNPPAGWGNPYQQGTVTLLSPSEALFRDHMGHHVLFRLRPGAKSFKHVCA